MIAEVDPPELACRILEAFTNTKRPAGATASQALAADKETKKMAERAARAAFDYFQELLIDARPVQ